MKIIDPTPFPSQTLEFALSTWHYKIRKSHLFYIVYKSVVLCSASFTLISTVDKRYAQLYNIPSMDPTYRG